MEFLLDLYYGGLWTEEFAFELIFFELLLCLYFHRKRHFRLKMIPSLMVIALVPPATHFLLAGDNMWLSIPSFFIVTALSAGMLLICYEISFWESLFVSGAAYSCYCIFYSLFRIACILLGVEAVSGGGAAIWTLCFLLCAAAAYLLLARRMKYTDRVNLNNTPLILLTLFVVTLDTVVKTYLLGLQLPSAVFIVWKGLSAICCALALLTQFGLLSQGKLWAENRQIEELFHQRHLQEEEIKQHIELINIRCHDLKKRIADLQYADDAVLRQELQDLQESVMIYDASIRTGNEALDVILTEKSLFCQKKRIRLICMAEGEKLSFLSDAELYSLFGNIVDNAVEAVRDLPEDDRRSIRLIIRANGRLLSIHEDNEFEGTLRFEDGLPQSGKGRFHGYGLKSVRRIVVNYQGEMELSAQAGRFVLNILLPIPE